MLNSRFEMAGQQINEHEYGSTECAYSEEQKEKKMKEKYTKAQRPRGQHQAHQRREIRRQKRDKEAGRKNEG